MQNIRISKKALDLLGNMKYLDLKSNEFSLVLVHAELPTKDETTETTVDNLYGLFIYIYDYFKLQTCFFLCLIS